MFAGYGSSTRALMLIFACIALIALIPVAAGANCSAIEPIYLERPTSTYAIAGPSITIFPVRGGVIRNDTRIEWLLDVFVERARVLKNVDGVPVEWNDATVSPVSFLGSQADVDPLEPQVLGVRCTGSNSKPCGQLLNYMRVSDMDCWMERVVAPFRGVSRESIYVHFTHPSYPQFVLRTEHHLVDAPVDFYGTNRGDVEHYQYSPDSLKVGYTIENFPWAGSPNVAFNEDSNNGSFIDFWANMSAEFPFANTFTLNRSSLEQTMQLVSKDGDFTMLAAISNIIITDDFGQADGGIPTSTTVDLGPVTLAGRVRNMVIADTIGHWTKLEYDPTLSSLFTGDTPTSTSPTGMGKSKLSSGAIAGIVIGIVVVLTIVAALVFTLVPAARNIVRPFANRNHQNEAAVSIELDSSSASAATSPSETPRSPTPEPSGAPKSAWSRTHATGS